MPESLSLQTALVEAIAHAVPIRGGYCIKRLPDDDMCVDVMRMMWNWRVTLSPRAPGDDHVTVIAGFCYYGHGVDHLGTARTMETAYQAAMAAAWLWDGTGTPPACDKVAFDGRRAVY